MSRLLVIALVLLAACDRPQFTSGEVCSLNTDCAEPLVCGLERCRRQCIDSRDCAEGARCEIDEEAGGARACVESIPELCIYNSDCGEPYICDEEQRCRLECVSDLDCDPLRYCLVERNRCMPRGDAGT